MSIALLPGPIALIDIAAALARTRSESIEEFAASRVRDLDGIDDRIGANVRLMADDLDGDAEIEPFGDLDDAAAEHTSQTSEPDPDLAHEAAVAQAGSDALARLAGELPPDDTPPLEPTVNLGGDGFEGVDVDYGGAPAPSPPPGGSGGGGGGGGGGAGGGGGGAPTQPGTVDKPPQRPPGDGPLPLPGPDDVDTGGGIKRPDETIGGGTERVFDIGPVTEE